MSNTGDHRLRARRRKVLVGTSVLAVTAMVSSLALWSGSSEVDAEIETANFHLEINTDVDRGFPEDAWQSVSTLSLSDVVSGEEATLWAPGSEAEADFMMRLSPQTTHPGHIPPEGLVVDSDGAQGYAWELRSEEPQFNESVIGGQSAISDNAERSAAGDPVVTDAVLFEPITLDVGEEYLLTMKIAATDDVVPNSVYTPSWEFFAALGVYQSEDESTDEDETPSEPEEPVDAPINPPAPSHNASANTVQIPMHPGVIYSHSGTVGVPLDGLVVTATPAEGYRFSDTAVTRWEFDYTFREVTPREPRRQNEPNVVRVLPTPGVTYSHNGDVVIPPAGLEITAEANEGYRIAEGVADTWFFEYEQQPSFTEWTVAPSVTSRSLNDIYAGDGFVLAVGSSGEVLLSEDAGETWRRSISGINGTSGTTINGIVPTTGGRLLAMAGGSTVRFSDNQGQSWSRSSIGFSTSVYGADSDGSRIVTVGLSGNMAMSDDAGVSWRSVSTPTTSVLYSVSVEGDRIVAVGGSGVLISEDAGQTWRSVDVPGSTSLFAVDVSGDLIVASGNSGLLMVSHDGGESWSTSWPSGGSRLSGVHINGDHVVVAAQNGVVLYSDDRARTWDQVSIGPRSGNVNAIFSIGDRIYVATSGGGIHYADR